MPFDSPCVRFIMLPHSSGQAGSSFPRLRGVLLIYKTLKLVLLQEEKRGDSPVPSSRSTPGHRTWHLQTHKCYFMRVRPVYGELLQIYIHYIHWCPWRKQQSFVITLTETVPRSFYPACSGAELGADIAGFLSEYIALISAVFVFLQPSEPQHLKASPTARLFNGECGKAADHTVNSETWTQWALQNVRTGLTQLLESGAAAAHIWNKTSNSRMRKSKKVSITQG